MPQHAEHLEPGLIVENAWRRHVLSAHFLPTEKSHHNGETLDKLLYLHAYLHRHLSWRYKPASSHIPNVYALTPRPYSTIFYPTQSPHENKTDYAKAVEARQRLDSQLQENKLVQDEFKLLKDDANIYKLIGPVLTKQDKAEAVTNVDKRIDFIQAEM